MKVSGYVISDQELSRSLVQVDSVLSWQSLQLVRDVGVFIGFAHFYWQCIQNLSAVAAPLTELTKGDPKQFLCGPRQQELLNLMKKLFLNTLIPCCFGKERQTVVGTDALNYALSCVLSQTMNKKLYPVALLSQKFYPAELNHEIHDKGLLAIVAAFKGWRPHLVGIRLPAIVFTNHKTLDRIVSAQLVIRTRGWIHGWIGLSNSLLSLNGRGKSRFTIKVSGVPP